MSGFFDDFAVMPPVEPERDRYRPAAWTGPPHGTMPAIVALDLDLGSSDVAAVRVTNAGAFPTGLALTLLVLLEDEFGELDPLLFGRHHRSGARDPGGDDSALRLGVQFADGTKATNSLAAEPSDPATRAIVLLPRGGGGGGGRWSQDLWLWPLPPPGPVRFVCDWRAAGIVRTEATVDAALLTEAAGRARVHFPDERPEANPQDRSGGWSHYA